MGSASRDKPVSIGTLLASPPPSYTVIKCRACANERSDYTVLATCES